MAEVVAAAWAAEEVVSTTAQAGFAAYMIAKPTMPLKATFTQIATSSDDETRLSLARADHTLSIVSNRAYIFGGETAAAKLASNDIHAVTLSSSDKPEPDYSIVPAIPDVEGGRVPAARKKHAACAFNAFVAVYGGVDEGGELIDGGSLIWLYNTAKSTWETLEPSSTAASPTARSGAKLFNHRNNLILYGGHDASGAGLKDVWAFNYAERTWTQRPEAPVSTPNASLADGVLYTVSGSDSMSSDLHYLPLSAQGEQEASWQTVPFPTNPLTPGPRPRIGGGLLHVTTGYGRNYLTYLFGARQAAGAEASSTEKPPTAEEATNEDPQYWSDIWTYQLPSSSPEAKLTTNLSDAIKPAKIKDKIRNALGYDSGGHSWGEAEVQPPTDLAAAAGKVHPGPRGFFGCDVMQDGRSLVVWGGVNAKGEKEGDGWVIKLE
ncbi:hypothetical protein LTR36_000802 [Oleoguttula mirabilis]|uniref:Galactose oxidase n=1 Tax=Oleoguttula mirabilis TaxID=1507867 RepID=A0AAV9J390_9PEZI|nr:hypothetical protein LTR36_000802 [Oleoguttula mirabilis]